MSTQITSSNLPSTETAHHALELTDILEVIFSHLGTPQELLQFRGVCQKWNSIIVHSLNTEWKNSFPLRLRYGSRVPLSLLQCDAERWTKEILESPPMITLIGTTTPISFDTVVIDQDLYLAGANPQWQHFLEIYGESIRHLKFNIRSGEAPEENSHHVTDCAQVVSMENLRSAFSAMPNLESLDFSIRFTHYGTKEGVGYPPVMFLFTHLPQLKKLTRITIQEPRGIEYSMEPYLFWREILGMAPNLTTLYLKWSRNLSAIATIVRRSSHLDNSLTILGITMLDSSTSFPDTVIRGMELTRFRLTRLELIGIEGIGRHLEAFLQNQSSTLTTLILGDRFSPNIGLRMINVPGVRPFLSTHTCRNMYFNTLSLPPVMGSLKILELNLPKYRVVSLTSYPKRFPALEELTLSNCKDPWCFWRSDQLLHLFAGEPSHTVKKFSLVGQIYLRERNAIISAIHSTFPLAVYKFDVFLTRTNLYLK